MKLGEKILFALSRDPESPDYHQEVAVKRSNVEQALTLLCTEYPDFKGTIAGKSILDYGCGYGFQAVAMAQNGARFVFGLDLSTEALKNGEQLSRQHHVEGSVIFRDSLKGFSQLFDLAISQNSMEHFPDPLQVLSTMKSYLKPDGMLMITFGPPWYAPYGSHMHFFTKFPWVNLLFSEKTVMRVRSYYRHDGAKVYEEVESGLNKMSIRKFERLVSECGLKVGKKRYGCVKGLDFLGKIPIVRELFINRVTYELFVRS